MIEHTFMQFFAYSTALHHPDQLVALPDQVGMWRWDDQEQRVALLDAQLATDELFYGRVSLHGTPRTPPRHSRAPLALPASTTTPPTPSSSSLPTVPSEAWQPPDVVLHVRGCAFALHLRLLRRRGRGLYKKLLLLRERAPDDLIDSMPENDQRPFSLRLLCSGEPGEPVAPMAGCTSGDKDEDGSCPLAGIEVPPANGKPWLYTRCMRHRGDKSHRHQYQYQYQHQHQHQHQPDQHQQQSDNVVVQPAEPTSGGDADAEGKEPISRRLFAGDEAAAMEQDSPFFGPWAEPSDDKENAPENATSPGQDHGSELVLSGDAASPPGSDAFRLEQLRQFQALAATRGHGVMHVELLRADPAAVATCIEFMYTKRVRFADERAAEQTARLCQWLDLKTDATLLYRSLRVAGAHATPSNWFRLVQASASLSDVAMRRVLLPELLAFLPTLRAPDDLMEFVQHTDVEPRLCTIADRVVVIDVVVALLHHVRLLDFWWNLLGGLSRWLDGARLVPRTTTPSLTHAPSLLALHKHFVPWAPVHMLPAMTIFRGRHAHGTARLATLLEFGEFALQVRLELLGPVPVLWRVVRVRAPQYMTGEPVDGARCKAELARDPSFCVRAQLRVKYLRTGTELVAKDEVAVAYQHCAREYGAWKPLVTAQSPTAELVPAKSEWLDGSDGGNHQHAETTIARFGGKVTVWGDTLCNLYHYLLVSTLFYCPPVSMPPSLADDMIVGEMRALPRESLLLALLSDRLRVPGGETTLARCLTLLVFNTNSPLGRKGGHVEPVDDESDADAVELFRCVRWCFVHVKQTMRTLALAPRRLRLYELVRAGLANKYLRFQRRQPWGWRGERGAYLLNTTNLTEFDIEAGDRHLSPSQVPMGDTDEPVPLREFPAGLPGVEC